MSYKSFHYKPLEPEQVIKFTKSSKYEYDFKKGDEATVKRVISPFPSATDTIYLVLHHKSDNLMWVTGNDVWPNDQLQIPIQENDHEWGGFDGLGYASTLIKPRKLKKARDKCTSTLSGYNCCLWQGHHGEHVSYAGWTWLERNSDSKRQIDSAFRR